LNPILTMALKKILIIHQGALGDFIMTFPIMIELRKTHFQVDALCQKKLGDLARKLNLIERSFPLESAAFAPLYGGLSDRIDLQTATFLQSYDRIILFSFSRSLQANMERFGAPVVLRIPPRPPVGEKIHVSRFLWSRLARAGLLEKAGLMSEASTVIQHLTLQRCIEAAPGPVLIHPGSGSRKKNWPLENFIRLEKMLRKDGLQAEFILGPAETYLREGLAASPATIPPIHIVDDLLQVLRLIKSACGFIGNDSGLSHLAAITGLPVTAVFGPSDPVRWKPPGPAVVVVHSGSDCSPCHEDKSRTCNSMECFKGISPQKVYAAFRELVKPVQI